MDIAALGSMQLDNIRLTAARSVNSTENFEDILRRIHDTDRSNMVVGGQRAGMSSDIDKNSELFQLCLELETFLVKNLLTSMRNTVEKSGFIDDSFAGKMYEDMLWDEYAKDFTKNAGFGMAEQAYRQLRNY